MLFVVTPPCHVIAGKSVDAGFMVRHPAFPFGTGKTDPGQYG